MSPVAVSADRRFHRAHVKPARRRAAWRSAAVAGAKYGLLLALVLFAAARVSTFVSTSPLLRIDRIVKKPAPQDAPSRMGVAGRYILTPAIFDEIRNQPTGAGGEIQLTDGIARLMEHEAVYAFQYAGKRYDCGSKEGFLEATVELALQHPDVGDSFRAYLKTLSL